MRTRFGHRIVCLFVVLGLLLVTVAVQVYRAVGEFVDAGSQVAHTMEVEKEILATLGSLRDAEASQRAFVISGSSERLADHHGALPRIAAHQSQLASLVANNPDQVRNAGEFGELLEQRLRGMSEILDLYQREGIATVRASSPVQRSRDEDTAIEAIAQRMLDIEDRLLAERQARTGEKAALTRVLTIGAVLFCIFILATALVFVLREQDRRLRGEIRVQAANDELTQSLDEAQRLGRTLRQLRDLGEMLQSCRSLAEATSGLAVTLPQLLPGMSGSISLINSSQNLVETVASWGQEGLAGEVLFNPDDCWALRRGQAYPPPRAVPPFRCRHLPAGGTDKQGHAHLCVPLIAQGAMLGILVLAADAEPDAAERAVAVAAADQVSMALANLRLQETLRTQSLRDPLTGLFNRRYLEASLDRELQRATRRKQPLSVLMLDIDHFKRFNDTHGHDAGDALLAQFGALLTRIVRSEDVACRYGGEEFTVLLHETDATQAIERAERICAAVRTLDVQHRRQTLGPVTVSIGIATAPHDGTAPDELLHAADRALYAAKHGGRDQARLAA